jgi:hypothetical protein
MKLSFKFLSFCKFTITRKIVNVSGVVGQGEKELIAKA